MKNTNTITYLSIFKGIEIEETATIKMIEGNKLYCIDEYHNNLIFNTDNGYCYTDNTTFGAKKVLNIKKQHD
jgi:hypothetical protein